LQITGSGKGLETVTPRHTPLGEHQPVGKNRRSSCPLTSEKLISLDTEFKVEFLHFAHRKVERQIDYLREWFWGYRSALRLEEKKEEVGKSPPVDYGLC